MSRTTVAEWLDGCEKIVRPPEPEDDKDPALP